VCYFPRDVVSPKRSRVRKNKLDGWTGLAARTLAETPKAVNVRLARETMEPRQTEFRCRASTLARGPTPLLEQVEPDLAVSRRP
jgi:hypothetical protein